MKRISYFLLSAFALMIVVTSISSCNKDKTPLTVPVEPGECADTVSFSGVIGPMIQANCSTSGCHDAATSTSGYNLETHANISINASIILSVIRHEPAVVAMPYYQPQLSDSLIDQFNCWVVQGKLNN